MVYGDIRNCLIYTDGSGVGVSSTNYAAGEVRQLLPSASLRVTCGRGVVPGQPPDQGYMKSWERVMGVVEEAPAVKIYSAGSHNWHQA